ncbi:MAG: CopG family transcriptional regulator [Myxococcota bacterium]
MVRSQIQLTESQHARLRAWADRLGISVAEAVRRCVDERLAKDDVTPSRSEQLRAALAVCGAHVDPEGRDDVAANHDLHLGRAFAR